MSTTVSDNQPNNKPALIARAVFEEYLTAMRMLRESNRTVAERRAAIVMRDAFLNDAELIVSVMAASHDALLAELKSLVAWVESETDGRDWPNAQLAQARAVIATAEAYA